MSGYCSFPSRPAKQEAEHNLTACIYLCCPIWGNVYCLYPHKIYHKMAREAWQVVSIFCSVVSGGPSGLNAAYPHCFIKTIRTETMSALRLKRSPKDFQTDIAQMLVLQLVASIFLGKPGLLPSNEDGGEGSCAAIIPERACDQAPEKRHGSFYTFHWKGL